MKKTGLVLLALFVGIISASQASALPRQGAKSQRITTASAVRLRAEANTSSKVVDTLQIGTVLDETGRSNAPQTINGVEEYWYKVAAPGGKTGWVFGGLTRVFDVNHRDDIYAEIARSRLEMDAEKLSFTDWVDLYGFLDRVASKAARDDLKAELELSRLLAMQRALAAVKVEEEGKDPYKSFIAKVGTQASYSEPSGEWLVASTLFWDLHTRYPSSPVSERIAWEAANNSLPGECETDIGCHLYVLSITDGQYLTLYPSGENAQAALNGMNETLEWIVDVVNGPEIEGFLDDAEWKRDTLKTCTTLRGIVSKTSGAKRDEVLQKLASVEARIGRT